MNGRFYAHPSKVFVVATRSIHTEQEGIIVECCIDGQQWTEMSPDVVDTSTDLAEIEAVTFAIKDQALERLRLR
ncbi:hypothetical protein AKO1_013238 [Acrasis kona]|uniref:Uncharacterized protein n=1 Tax=Acrasis kona TaxID=1008807 RepID=A0AAW2YZA5_9EUKA